MATDGEASEPSLSGFDETTLIAFRKFVYELAGVPDDERGTPESIIQAATEAARRLDQLDERVEHTEFELDQLIADLPTQQRSRWEKKWRIVSRVAEEASAGARYHAIKTDGAARVADCSGRNAKNIMDELAETFDSLETVVKDDPHAQKTLRVTFGDDGPDAWLDQFEPVFRREAEE